MTINPELRRNLWLELTPLRLIGMPVVLGLIFTLNPFCVPNWIGRKSK